MISSVMFTHWTLYSATIVLIRKVLDPLRLCTVLDLTRLWC